MAGVQDSKLAIAVARAGGVGSLPCAMLPKEVLVAELERIQAAGISAYNLNFFCHRQPEVDAERERLWKQALEPYYREFEVDRGSIAPGPGRQPFCAQILEAIRPFRPPIVSFHFGLPERAFVDAIHAWGGQVWSTATTLEEALWLEAQGADAVIAQGLEAGGHRGMFLTEDLASQRELQSLLSDLVNALSVPVLAAGGIASPEQCRSALQRGAWAAQVGTAYLCCDEATTSDLHRAYLLDYRAHDTQVTNLFSGRPARGIVNRLMTELGPLSQETPAFPLAATALAPLRAAAEARGSADFTPLWCGGDPSGCREVSAARQTRWLAGVEA